MVIDIGDAELFPLVILPFLIFLARILDVSVGTIRIIFVSRGYKVLAMLCGFFEVLVWVIAIGQIMQDLTNIMNYIAFSAGFAVGNYVGITIEEKIAMGLVSLWIVTEKDATELIKYLSTKRYEVTSVGAKGISGHVRIVFTVVKRKELDRVLEIVKKFNPNAFISIGDVRAVSDPSLQPPQKKREFFVAPFASFRSLRKAK